MKILVVGGGGREHAIIKKLKENKSVETIYALPGNGGIAKDAVCVPIEATDIAKIVDFAVENKIDYAVVAPDDPLASASESQRRSCRSNHPWMSGRRRAGAADS